MPSPSSLFGRILWTRERSRNASWKPLGEIVDAYSRAGSDTTDRILVALTEKGEIVERPLRETHEISDANEQLLILPPGKHPPPNIPGGEPPDEDPVSARLTI